MLRVGGRLQNSTLEYQSKHQSLLPSKHHVTKLLVIDVHESVGHLRQECPDQFETEVLDYPGTGRCPKSTWQLFDLPKTKCSKGSRSNGRFTQREANS